VRAQYWNGTTFVTNPEDDCTPLNAANVALGNYRRNLSAGETIVSTSGILSDGAGTLRLTAPGAANAGSVDVSVNLTGPLPGSPAGASCTAGMPASASSGFSYLQGAWCGAAYDRDPTARATFGVYRNSARVIFRRENF
jgi:MSHA biogenesis protein MshQ